MVFALGSKPPFFALRNHPASRNKEKTPGFLLSWGREAPLPEIHGPFVIYNHSPVAFGGADSQKESSPWAKHKKNPENIWIKMRHPWTHKAPCPCVYCKRIQLGWCCDHVTQVAQPFSHPTNFWILSNVGYRTEMPLFTITGQLVSHDIYRYTNLLSVTTSPKMEKI